MINSRLKLNRFLVFFENKIIYDEKFHDGINVIKGAHSVGKSTLFDLIFFVLGGEIKREEWKFPITNCNEVKAEIEVNGKTLTLAREIVSSAKPKIRIYDGNYVDSTNNALSWLTFGPVRSDSRASFSEMLFDLLGWGQQKTESFNNLTMHQILRLSYLNQTSKTTRIFREEIDKHGDNDSTRKAIGEFLLGLDDLTSYDKRQQKKWKVIELSKFEAKRDSIRNILGTNSNLSIDEINKLVTEQNESINKLLIEKVFKLDDSDSESDDKNIISSRRSLLFKKIKHHTESMNSINKELLFVQDEMDDCILYSKSLDFRIKSLGESEETFKALGNVSFNYCPSCFNQIKDSVLEDQCSLCKETIPKSDLSEKYTETLAELKYQEKQNLHTIELFRTKIFSLNKEKFIVDEKLSRAQNELKDLSTQSNKRELLTMVYTKKITFIESGIAELEKMIPLVKLLEEYNSSISSINREIVELDLEIEKLKINSEKRNFKVTTSLANIATKFLEDGSGHEESFKDATKREVEIDFEKDRWLLGGRSSFSESSNAVKKSAMHIGFLLQSLLDNDTRYPLFSIMDFECADVDLERSHTIQRNIHELFKDQKGFQLLITSSKISTELNIDRYAVGRYYKKNDYIFQI